MCAYKCVCTCVVNVYSLCVHASVFGRSVCIVCVHASVFVSHVYMCGMSVHVCLYMHTCMHMHKLIHTNVHTSLSSVCPECIPVSVCTSVPTYKTGN